MVDNFFGWESERVVALTSERNIMAQITCAKTLLSVIIVGGRSKDQGVLPACDRPDLKSATPARVAVLHLLGILEFPKLDTCNGSTLIDTGDK